MYLDKIFDDTTKYTYLTLPEDVVSGRLYSFGFGMWIRNNWGLWGNSDLKKYFIENGVTHPDHMSGIILSAYYNYLNHEPFEINYHPDTLISKMTGKERMEYIEAKMTSSKELLKYFPINDTIIVYVSLTTQKLFKKTDESVRAIALVNEHKEDKLVVEILKIPLREKQTTEYEVGQIIQENPYWCELIPPKNWKWE